MIYHRLAGLGTLFSARTVQAFRLDLGLAATALFAWFLTGCFEVRLAFSRDQLQAAVASVAWRPHWPIGPWLLAVAGLTVALVLHHRATVDGAELGRRLRRATLLALVLLAGRLVACWDPALSLFPYLGILWAPHASWALGLAYLVLPLLAIGSSAANHRRSFLGNRSVAGVVFALAFCLYGVYALYFCQISMLHGDECHYLMVTQSLLNDGDMDLANNVDEKSIGEFHFLAIEPHKAPASPPGKVYSIHPIGLSVTLIPAYWAGLKLWSNARLGSVLFMVALASGCLSLAFLWLGRLGFGRTTSLLAVTAVAVTPPYFLFSNQLYPELPALFITLIVLLVTVHWQVGEPRYHRVGGRAEPLWLGFLGLLIGCLPFLHPRYAPLAAGCGALLLLQAWHSPDKRRCLTMLGVAVAVDWSALLAFNLTFSGDWMGHFRPGNAWGGDALRVGTLLESAPGQWLHATKGLLNGAPLFLLAAIGWILGAYRRDRRVLVAALLYLVTAVPNGLHPLWTFGFGFPARFLMTALPALWCGLALAAPVVARSRTMLFLAALAFAISVETTASSMIVPEGAYEGRNLDGRVIAEFYPLEAHLVPPGKAGLPLGPLSFWVLVLAGWFLALDGLRARQRRWRGAALLAVALLPAAYGRTAEVSALLPQVISPAVPYVAGGVVEQTARAILAKLTPALIGDKVTRIGAQLEARAPTKDAGHIARHLIPLTAPGTEIVVTVPFTAEAPDSGVAGYAILQQRRTLAAVGDCEKRLSVPLISTANQAWFTIPLLNQRLCFLQTDFTGSGSVLLDVPKVLFIPRRFRQRVTEVTRLSPDAGSPAAAEGLLNASRVVLPPGVYRATFHLEGSAASALFWRAPRPISMAAFLAPVDSAEARSRLPLQGQRWAAMNLDETARAVEADYRLPLSESIEAAWWLSFPWLRERVYQLDLPVAEASEALLLVQYAGSFDIRLGEIVIHRLEGISLATGVNRIAEEGRPR